MDNNNYFAHETAVIDEGCEIGNGAKIWHFSHIMSNSIIGENCNIGQNVVVSPKVVLGKNVKVQNNVSLHGFTASLSVKPFSEACKVQKRLHCKASLKGVTFSEELQFSIL